MSKKIMIVDDEPDIREIVKYNMEKEGYQVIEASDGEEAIELIKNHPDLIILDIMMTGKDGYEVCREVREAGNNIPIIFLTAMDREFDEVKGLEIGGDDFLTKPFSPKKLIARVKAVLRRADQITSKGKTIVFDGLKIDTQTYVATVNDVEIRLPRKEFELLSYFMSKPNYIFNRDDLLSQVWEEDVYVVDRTIDVHINRIRSKLGPYREWIETVKGVGYRFRPKTNEL